LNSYFKDNHNNTQFEVKATIYSIKSKWLFHMQYFQTTSKKN